MSAVQFLRDVFPRPELPCTSVGFQDTMEVVASTLKAWFRIDSVTYNLLYWLVIAQPIFKGRKIDPTSQWKK